MDSNVPKARELYQGDINGAVAQVQKITGVEITPAWWEVHVGNSGSAEQILDRFDAAFLIEYKQRKSGQRGDEF